MSLNPPAFTVENEAGTSPVLLLCEHASNHIPARYNRLGLSPSDLERHIAYDIGAAAVARQMSRLLDAPLVLTGYSRLLIDCNRPAAARSLIPERSEDTDIPGNIGLSEVERAERDRLYFAPFREYVAAHLDERVRIGRPTVLIGMHPGLSRGRPRLAGGSAVFAGARLGAGADRGAARRRAIVRHRRQRAV